MRIEHNNRLAASTALLILLALGTLAAGLAAAPRSAAKTTITVCPTGPPACDFAAIQPALDAAVPGDTVQVEPGSYDGQLTLKSGVRLLSSGGAEVTAVTAVAGPLVSATAVSDATIDGFRFDGQDQLALGLSLTDSQLTLANSRITAVAGADGQSGSPAGETAVAIQILGSSQLTVTQSHVERVRGGDGLLGAGAAGGAAFGIWSDGPVTLTVRDSTVRQLAGGAAGTYADWPFSCDGAGGAVTGIHAANVLALTVERSTVAELTGGAPCQTGVVSCNQRPGAVIGIAASGGTAVIGDNNLSDLVAWAGHGSDPHFGIRLHGGSEAQLAGNTVGPFAVVFAPGQSMAVHRPLAQCLAAPGYITGVDARQYAALTLAGNYVHDLATVGNGGQLVGFRIEQATTAGLTANMATRFQGGNDGLAGIGLDLAQLVTATLQANQVSELTGGDGGVFDPYLQPGRIGGSVAGLRLTDIATAALQNNLIRGLAGGAGGYPYEPVVTGRPGGDAASLLLASTTATILHNSTYDARPGPGGAPDGLAGRGSGLNLRDGTAVTGFNNAFIRQGAAISATVAATAALDYSALWDNEVDYLGVSPGAHDLAADPGYVDPASGDLRLGVDSALVDAGLEVDVAVDFEGKPRPVDGDADGSIRPDIGADEYWPGLQGSTTAVNTPVAWPGDTLFYTITLRSGLTHLDLPGVSLTNTLPAHTSYITGSLAASPGTATVTGGIISWYGDLPALGMATIRFRTAVDETLAGPTALVNRTEVDDGVGRPVILERITLANPRQQHLPVLTFSRP